MERRIKTDPSSYTRLDGNPLKDLQSCPRASTTLLHCSVGAQVDYDRSAPPSDECGGGGSDCKNDPSASEPQPEALRMRRLHLVSA